MFEGAKLQATNSKRTEAVKAESAELLDKGELFITRIFGEDEPYRSACFHALDGIEMENTVPRPIGTPMSLPPVRLVVIPGTIGTIKYKRWARKRIPGTIKVTEGWETVDAGVDATLSHKDARYVIRMSGWPTVQNASNGNRMGHVVEYDWLAWEAKRPDASPEVLELWAAVSAEYGGGAKQQTKKKDKSNEAPASL